MGEGLEYSASLLKITTIIMAVEYVVIVMEDI